MSIGLEKYYKILGLPTTAGEAEIKKHYRKLVFIHHPDKNGGDETQFIAIKEAYEILSGKKSIPQQTVVTSRSTSSVAQKTKEERVREARQRHKDQVYKEYIANDRYFKNLVNGTKWKIMQLIAIIGTLLAVVLLTESLLPKHYEEARIERFSRFSYGSFHDNVTSLVVLDNSDRYFVADISYTMCGENTEVLVEKSWILHNPLRIITKHPTYFEYFNIEISIGAHNRVIAFVLLIPLFTLLYKKRTILFTILYLASLYGVGIIIVYILLTYDRWAHLLSLGFL